MENKSHAFMAGLFTLVLLAAVAASVYWFNRDNRVRLPYDLVSHTNVTGLNPESAVRYRGLSVGKVESIKFDPRTPGQILIRILVNEGTPMTRSTFATLSYQGVTGLAFVQLDDDGHDRTLLPSSEKHVAQLRLRPSFVDELQRRGNNLVHQLEEATFGQYAVVARQPAGHARFDQQREGRGAKRGSRGAAARARHGAVAGHRARTHRHACRGPSSDRSIDRSSGAARAQPG